jgi:hypothetical protein
MAGRTAPTPEREDIASQVVAWRRDVLLEAGCPAAVAEAIARGNADLHRAVEMLSNGCPPELAERILT